LRQAGQSRPVTDDECGNAQGFVRRGAGAQGRHQELDEVGETVGGRRLAAGKTAPRSVEQGPHPGITPV
jgi:hypothetical protein